MKKKMIMDVDMDTDKDMDTDTGHGHGDWNLVSHRQAIFEIGLGTNFVILSPYNLLTAPPQYSRHTVQCRLVPYSDSTLNTNTTGRSNLTKLDFP